jgi:hypothetical protein
LPLSRRTFERVSLGAIGEDRSLERLAREDSDRARVGVAPAGSVRVEVDVDPLKQRARESLVVTIEAGKGS